MKHFGKTIKRDYYIPLLDDRNINDQGIDATGLSTTKAHTVRMVDPKGVVKAFKAETLDKAKNAAVEAFKRMGFVVTSFTDLQTALTSAGWQITEHEVPATGNLYGSSKDVGTIVGKLPTLSETGGRVNRVGFTRVTMEASIENFGFFEEYTQDSVQFDSDAELMSHIYRETSKAANEINEAQIQIDLLNGANVVLYGGNATSIGAVDNTSVLTYDMLVKLETIINENRCPKDTQIITGSRMTDTKTIGAARYAFVGSELKKSLLKMKDYFNNPAFVPVQQYAEAGNVAAGEIGSIGGFRFIENPYMFHWEGKGAEATEDKGFMATDSKYDVFPVLVVGSHSFTSIGFQTEGTSTKFKVIHQKPGERTADRHDPYGKTGFYSIQWWYSTMIQRPEWIACCKVVAER